MQGIHLEPGRAFMTTRENNRLQLPLSHDDEGQYMLDMVFNGGRIQKINTSICVYKRSKGYIWQPISDITQKNWREFRDKICSYLNSLAQEAVMHFLKNENSQNAEKVNYPILLDLFNRLPNSEKKDMLLKHRNSTFTQKTCTKCFALSHNKKKCIHPTCTGLCTDCFNEWEETRDAPGSQYCPACGAEQHIECPICQEEKTPDDLFKLNCNHSVCWKCFGQSIVNKQILNKCPLCRKNIII